MLFVGDDWAEGHHDIEIIDDQGKVLVRRRLPEGLEGVTRMHSLIAAQIPDDWVDRDPDEVAGLVKVGIETDRGSWVAALVAAGYEVFAINPLSVARYRERHSTSGAKSDAADAHLLAEIVRLDRAHHRPADRAHPPVADLGPQSPRGPAALDVAGVFSRSPVGL
jgi:transposase